MTFVYIAHNHNHWLLQCIEANVKIDFVILFPNCREFRCVFSCLRF